MTQVQEESITGESLAVPALLDIAAGYTLARCLHVVADLGVADALDGAACTAAELAEAVGVQPDPLERVLLLLSAHGVFEAQDGGFAHTTCGPRPTRGWCVRANMAAPTCCHW